MRRFKFAAVMCSFSLALIISGCTAMAQEPCMYCGDNPSVQYEKADGTPVYVCKDCSSVCMICGDERATKHYDSLLGIVFVCDDCYQMATGE